ncbi:MAG TPA: DDE-type integrase/transposase/recombinase [Nitrososphaerales archaeon]|nr:DDE-type integrase/transposase/recombinase [Nitrososphaerales archaeon]
MNPREQRGRLICDLKTEVRRVDSNEYAVRSQSGKADYQVRATELGWSCSCPDYSYRQEKCKHIFAVEFSKTLRTEVELGILAPFETTDGCIFCGSKHVVKDGLRKNKGRSIQKFNCLDCRRYFTINIGFERMKHNPKAITTALQLYFSGESLRNTQKSLRLLGVEVSHKTVWMWIRKYVGLMEKHLDKLTPQVSDTWRADEVWVNVRGNMKYVFAIMDDETRFWLAQEVADTKFTHDARNIFRMGKERAGKVPKTMITDGLHAYIKAFNWEYRTPKADSPVHIREIRISGKIHNNKMERMNGEIRDREKTMRALKTKETPILKGLQIYHNFVRPHQALKGKTPADLAGIIVQGENKWLTLIQNASKNQTRT